MKYSKEKKEFEKFVEENDMGYFPSLEYGIDREDAEKLWSWIVSKFQSHDRKMLEWVLKEVVGENEDLFVGDPNYTCYRLTGHEYDEFGYCKICHNPSQEAYNRGRNISKQRQLINQKLKEVEK